MFTGSLPPSRPKKAAKGKSPGGRATWHLRDGSRFCCNCNSRLTHIHPRHTLHAHVCTTHPTHARPAHAPHTRHMHTSHTHTPHTHALHTHACTTHTHTHTSHTHVPHAPRAHTPRTHTRTHTRGRSAGSWLRVAPCPPPDTLSPAHEGARAGRGLRVRG